MDDLSSIAHTKWECKYHVIFIPKYRRKALFGELRQHLGSVFRELAKQKECKVEEGHLLVDHVHMLISIPPKYSVAQIVGYIKLRFRPLSGGSVAAPRRACGTRWDLLQVGANQGHP